MKLPFSFLVLLIACLMHYCLAKEQVVTVKGQVICDKRSMRMVRVELREHDTFDPDDSLGETHTDKDGYFTLKGKEDEVGDIKPYIRIQHTCDVKDRATCTRQSDFEIPHDKVGEGKTYDMNFVNLNLRGNKDVETCS